MLFVLLGQLFCLYCECTFTFTGQVLFYYCERWSFGAKLLSNKLAGRHPANASDYSNVDDYIPKPAISMINVMDLTKYSVLTETNFKIEQGNFTLLTV